MKVLPGLDIDVLVRGPTGIWLLESKYYVGIVRYKDGKWQHIKSGGEEALDLTEQWERERDAALEVLEEAGLLREHLWLRPAVRGGVAFTHGQVETDIDESCPIAWNIPWGWVEVITTAKAWPKLSLEMRLKVIDAFLERHHALQGEKGISAIEVAQSICKRY